MEEKKSILEKWGFIQKVEDSSAELPSSQSVNQHEAAARAKGAQKSAVPPLSESISRVKTESAVRKNTSHGANPMDRFIGVQDLYAAEKMPLSGKETIYTVENLLKALPDGLPADLVRVTLQNVTQASFMELDELVADGEARISALQNYYSQFSQRTDSVIRQYKEEIEQLKMKISECQSMIEERKALQTNQAHAIQYEVDRISNIISSAK